LFDKSLTIIISYEEKRKINKVILKEIRGREGKGKKKNWIFLI